MATPNARKIIFGTSVIPQETYNTTDTRITREDGTLAGRTTDSFEDYKIDTTVGKKLGGKGTAIIHASQDGFVSFFNSIYDDTEGISILWDHAEENWDAVTSITSSDYTLREDSVTCNFLYIKNTGLKTCYVALEGDEWDIILNPQASISVRLNSISSSAVKVKTTGSDTTTIEYVLAKEP